MSECKKLSDWLPEFALDADDCPQAKQIRKHLSVCQNCVDQLRELRESWADVGGHLTAIEPSQELQSRVFSVMRKPRSRMNNDTFSGNGEVDGDSEKDGTLDSNARNSFVQSSHARPLGGNAISATDTIRDGRAKSRWIIPVSVAAGLLVMASVGWLYSNRTSEVTTAPGTLNADWSREDQEIALPLETHLVSFVGLDPERQIPAHFLCDTEMRKAHLVLFRLDSLDRDSTYIVWLLSKSDHVLASSVLQLNDTAIGKTKIDLPADIKQATRIVVTREAGSDVSKPSNDIVVSGTFDEL